VRIETGPRRFSLIDGCMSPWDNADVPDRQGRA
jgi:hypothetical protein